ncbi:MAG: hypothetical protein Ct9H300mP20_01720 [Gammaproteobacteria bacterium]|nr:MAG: hypothetical protein Ct9H300mP20_01720 [Gammaproteobacteria bacterium]
MSKGAEGVYSEILEKGTQQDLIDRMQTRENFMKYSITLLLRRNLMTI